MPATRELVELQSVDNELGVRRARLDEIARLLGDDAALRALARQLRVYQGEMDLALSKQGELDDAIGGYSTRVEAAEAKLYSGAVTSSRELQDLQADVNMLKRHRGEQEDALLVVLDEIDEAKRKRDETAGSLESQTAAWKADQQSMTEERARLEEEAFELELRREDLVSHIPPPEVALYDQVRRSHPSHPVARMHNGACDACRVGVPTRMQMDVRSGSQPSRCPNCGRILLPE